MTFSLCYQGNVLAKSRSPKHFFQKHLQYLVSHSQCHLHITSTHHNHNNHPKRTSGTHNIDKHTTLKISSVYAHEGNDIEKFSEGENKTPSEIFAMTLKIPVYSTKENAHHHTKNAILGRRQMRPTYIYIPGATHGGYSGMISTLVRAE